MSPPLAESGVEQAALGWLGSLGYGVLFGPEIAPGQPAAEREDYGQVVLGRRLRQALQRLNPQVPSDALEEATLTVLEQAEVLCSDIAVA